MPGPPTSVFVPAPPARVSLPGPPLTVILTDAALLPTTALSAAAVAQPVGKVVQPATSPVKTSAPAFPLNSKAGGTSPDVAEILRSAYWVEPRAVSALMSRRFTPALGEPITMLLPPVGEMTITREMGAPLVGPSSATVMRGVAEVARPKRPSVKSKTIFSASVTEPAPTTAILPVVEFTTQRLPLASLALAYTHGSTVQPAVLPT